MKRYEDYLWGTHEDCPAYIEFLEATDGSWVKWEDVEALLRENSELRSRIKALNSYLDEIGA